MTKHTRSLIPAHKATLHCSSLHTKPKQLCVAHPRTPSPSNFALLIPAHQATLQSSGVCSAKAYDPHTPSNFWAGEGCNADQARACVEPVQSWHHDGSHSLCQIRAKPASQQFAQSMSNPCRDSTMLCASVSADQLTGNMHGGKRHPQAQLPGHLPWTCMLPCW